MSPSTVDEILRQLDESDVIYLDPDSHEIASAYPFSNLPTPHLVAFLDEHGNECGKAYAMCAVDALGIPFMLNEMVRISSRCGSCGAEISLDLKGAVEDAREEAVWFGLRRSDHAATSACPTIQFFCSKEHLAKWIDANPGQVGTPLSLKEAAELAREIFRGMLE